MLKLFKSEEQITIVGKDTTIQGTVDCKSIHVDGKLILTSKSVSTFETFSLGASGEATGNIQTGVCELCGVFSGSIKSDSVKVCKGAIVTADITYTTSISIEDGSVVSGKIIKE